MFLKTWEFSLGLKTSTFYSCSDYRISLTVFCSSGHAMIIRQVYMYVTDCCARWLFSKRYIQWSMHFMIWQNKLTVILCGIFSISNLCQMLVILFFVGSSCEIPLHEGDHLFRMEWRDTCPPPSLPPSGTARAELNRTGEDAGCLLWGSGLPTVLPFPWELPRASRWDPAQEGGEAWCCCFWELRNSFSPGLHALPWMSRPWRAPWLGPVAAHSYLNPRP